MVSRKAIVLALALGIPLVACQPAQRETGGGGGGQAQAPTMVVETPGDHFETAYTQLAEAHINLVQGDWNGAAASMRNVQANLNDMKKTKTPLPPDVTSRINELERGVTNLDKLIASHDPKAVAQSRALMATFTQQSFLAQVGMTGGGAGTTPQKK
ncbi:hypothetical protein D3C87_963880 [compost metagenome]